MKLAVWQFFLVTAVQASTAKWLHKMRREARAAVLTVLVKDLLPARFPGLFREPPRIDSSLKQGWCNSVLRITSAQGRRYVLRVSFRPENGSKERLWAPYHKEIWVMRAASVVAPVPWIPETNDVHYSMVPNPHGAGEQQIAFMLMPYLPYNSAASQIKPEQADRFMHELGAIASRINALPAPGFGMSFDAAGGRFRLSSWPEFWQELQSHCELDALVQHGCLPQRIGVEMRARFQALSALRLPARLFHHDFAGNWENVLLDEGGRIGAIIDWEFAGGGPAALFEMASTEYVMSRDGFTAGASRTRLAAFRAGYGINAVDYEQQWREGVESMLLYYAAKAINTYRKLCEKKETAGAPWRKAFAKRARQLVESRLKRRAGQVSGRPLRKAA